VPVSVVYGFVNGLAVVIFMSQLVQFQTVSDSGQTTWLTGSNLYLMLGLVALTVGVIVGLPKLTRAVPSTLVAIVVVSAIVIGFDIPTRSVSDIAQISGGLPQFHLPSVPLGMETLWVILPYSVIMAAVGLIESLLTLAVVDEMTETRGQGNRECLAQGAANIASGLTAGMGGCAMIGQSMINVSSGARHRLSGIVAAVALILFVQFGGELIGQIPMAALVGVMVMVSVGTFEWASLRTLRRMPWMDVAITAIVTLITAVFHNLAVAVLVGVILAALNFAWENAVRIRARKFEDHRGVKHYQIYGLLFFGSVTAFSEKFDPENDLQEVVIDFHESRLVDQSAIEAVHKVTERYAKQGKRITLKHLSSDSRLLLRNAHTLVQVNYWADPDYRVLSDSLEG
jgi:SulP family sulfate permease